MAVPITKSLRSSSLFLKSTASFVVVAFLSLTLQPLALAANMPAPQKQSPRVESNDEKLERTLEALEDRLEKLDTKLTRRESSQREQDEVKGLQTELETLHTEALREFDDIARHIKDKKLPDVIAQRHTAAVAAYTAEMQKLKASLAGVIASKDDSERKLNAHSIRKHLHDKRPKRTVTPINVENLPFRVSPGKVRKPKETEHEFKTSLFPERIQVASTALTSGIIAVAGALAAPTTADLLSTEDAPITPEIQALANSLGKQPVAIYNWVRNNIRFLPTYGSIQGAAVTLQAKQGNAFDTASLLIALLRASGIHARYTYGTVEIPIEKVMNWVGGVTAPNAAIELLAQGGIPTVGVISGGRIVAVRLEHVWVEAWVDFTPSRGAVHRQGDSWVRLDASFKQYDYVRGMDIQTNVPFDAQSFINQATVGAQINDAQRSVTGINTATVQSQLSTYETQVGTFIDASKPNATVGDVLGRQQIKEIKHQTLPSALPYKPIAVGSTLAVLPNNLRHRLQFDLYTSPTNRALEAPSLTYTQSLPSLAGKKVVLSFDPSTPADQAVIDNAIDSGARSFPVYLVYANPVLKIEGQTVATGYSDQLGLKQGLTITLIKPWTTSSQNYDVVTGDVAAIGINAAGITPSLFEARIQQHDLSKGEDPDFTAEMLYQLILAWWGERTTFNQLLADNNRVHYYQLPSHGIVSAPLTVRYLFGLPRSGSYKRRVIDVKENLIMVAHTNNEAEPRARFGIVSGTIGSYLESSVLDQAFLYEPGTSFSAVEGLRRANEQGIPIYTIDRTNVASALAAISLDAETEQEIADGVNAGLIAYAPQRELTHNGFTGAGYIIMDPATGSGPRKVTGGRDGADSPAPEAVYPFPQISATGVHMMVMGMAQRSSPVGRNMPIVISSSGLVMGVMLGAVAIPVEVVIAVLMLLTILFLIARTQTVATDRTHERTNLYLRHYSKADSIFSYINVYKGIFGTKGGAFGDGVYMTEERSFQVPINAPTRQLIVCPVTPNQDLSIRHYLKLGDRLNDGTKKVIDAWLELFFPRKLPGMEKYINPLGATEWVIRRPVLPDSRGQGRPFFLFAEGAELVDSCP